MTRIAFHSNQLSERGVDVALFDYARFNEEVLHNETVVVSNRNGNMSSLEKFKNRFKDVILYDSIKEISNICQDNKVDIFYAQKFGDFDNVISYTCKNAIHAVFDARPINKHGDAYASISWWLSKTQSFGSIPYVPYIVYLDKHDKNMRERLEIPQNAIVFGRYGGPEQFNLDFVHKVIKEVIEDRDDIYFLFMNTNKFCEDHKQIIHLPKTTDEYTKVEFINTCDSMLHARREGETFGLAIAEFSFMGKPVVTWAHGYDQAHLDMLGPKALTYSFDADLYKMLIEFEQFLELDTNWDCYSKKYSPENVMKGKFSDIFIKPLL